VSLGTWGLSIHAPSSATFSQPQVQVNKAPSRAAQLATRLRPEVVFHLAAQADVGTSVERPAFDAEGADLYRLCAETAGVEQQPRFNPERPGDVRHRVLDASLAERELGWRAGTTVAHGLARTWASVRAF